MRSRTRLLVTAGLVALVVAAVLAAQHLLLVPSQVSSVTTPEVKTNCTSMVQDSSHDQLTPTSGTILFGCSARSGWPPASLYCSGGCPGAFPAFNVTQTANYTAVFNLSQYYAGLFVAGTTGCAPSAASGSPTQLSDGMKVQLSGSSSSPSFYYYCATYAGVASTGASLSSFSISWMSGSMVFSQNFPSAIIPPGPPPTALSVVRGTDNKLYYATFAGSWNGWQSLGGGTSGVGVLCPGSSGTVYFAARSSDNVSLVLKIYSNGAWSAVSSPGGTTTGEPACTSMNGMLHLLVQGSNYGLWYNSLNESSGIWTGWQSLGGILFSPPVVAASPSINRLDVVLVGGSGSIYHIARLSNGTWSQWEQVGGSASDTPAVSSDERTLHLVVRGGDNGIYYNALNFTNGMWSGWISLSGTTGVAPSLAADSSGTLHLFVTGLDGGIYDRSLPSGGVWSSSWDNPGGITSLPVAVTPQGPNILIMVTGTNGGIFSNVLAASIWQGWTSLEGSTALEPALCGIA